MRSGALRLARSIAFPRAGHSKIHSTAQQPQAPPPRLELFRSLWGVEGVSRALFDRLRSEGYTGVETGPFIVTADGAPNWDPHPRDAGARAALREDLQASGLVMIGMLHSAGYPVHGQRSAQEHLASLRRQAEAAVGEMGAVMLNIHAGRDAWTVDEAIPLLAGIADLEVEVGVPCVVETHRQRLFWNPWQTRDLIKACDAQGIPLKLNADLSHWCAGGERVFDPAFDTEFGDIIDMVAERAHLVHARVGWAQGAQVPDPRVPEYQAELEAHEGWWHTILGSMATRGVPVRLEPEFGPAPYMVHEPASGRPLADLWEVNSFIARRQAARWASRHGS